MPYHAASNSAEHRPGNAIFILHRSTMGHCDVATLLTRCFNRFLDWGCRNNLSVLRAPFKHVQTGHCRYAQRQLRHQSRYPANIDLFTGNTSFFAVMPIMQAKEKSSYQTEDEKAREWLEILKDSEESERMPDTTRLPIALFLKGG
ncbi:Uncharacterised protein [Escherichia coli]|nr:Uncharacterised protein [Escherichia coli]